MRQEYTGQFTQCIHPHNHFTTYSCRKLERTIKEYHERIRALREVKYTKYPSTRKKKQPLCPNLRKGFKNKESVVHFFTTMKNSDSKLLLLLQFFYALRVGEVSTATYNPYTKLVRVETEKAGGTCIHYLPFIEGTERLFDNKPVSKDCLRNHFTKHCKRLGGEYYDVYHHSKAGKLSRLTTHSLRVTAANLLRAHTKDPYKTKVFLRHSLNRIYGATSHYMEYPEEEFRKDLNETFQPILHTLNL